LSLDNAMLGQFMLSQPLVVGGIFGSLLGDPLTGLFVGALIQLIWAGVIPVGAYIPSDHTITGGVAVVLTEQFVHQLGLALGPSLVFALIVSIPAGALAGLIDRAIREYFNTALSRRAEFVAESGRVPFLGGYLGLALVPAFLRGLIVYLLWLGPGALLAQKILANLPAPVMAGLGLAYWVLPALTFAAVIELSVRDRIHGWAVGTFALVWPALWLWPEQGWLLFMLAVIFGAGVAWWRGNR